jgi:hypothetical protein
VSYEPRFAWFEVKGPDGQLRAAEFVRAGFLTMGDSPELYFFRVAGEEAVVGISGDALRRLEQGRRRLTREEKIDMVGLWLKQRIQEGATLDSQNLFLRDEELVRMTGELDIPV